MKIAEQHVSFQRLLDCGAEQLYDVKLLRRWWGDQDQLPLSTIVQADQIALSRIIWVCFHLPSPPVTALHKASFHTANEICSRAEKEQIYVDLRSRFALTKKGEWLHGLISLGELHSAREKAFLAIRDIAELGGDRRSLLLAKAFHEACSSDSETALRNFHYTTEKDPLAENGAILRQKIMDEFKEQELAL